MNKNQEKTKEALAKIETALQNIHTGADWLQYLAFQAKFYRYSARNALLIRSQNLEARYAKGYKSWCKLDRFVKKGAKGISILAPCIKEVEEYKESADKAEYRDKNGEKVSKNVLVGFTVKYVFDIADTDGSDEHIPILVKGLSGDSEDEEDLYEHLKAVIAAQGHILSGKLRERPLRVATTSLRALSLYGLIWRYCSASKRCSTSTGIV